MESEGVGEEAVFEREDEEGKGDVQAREQAAGTGCPRVDKEEAEQTKSGGGGEVEADSQVAKPCLCHPGQEGGEDETGGGKEDGKDFGAILEEIDAGGKTRSEQQE